VNKYEGLTLVSEGDNKFEVVEVVLDESTIRKLLSVNTRNRKLQGNRIDLYLKCITGSEWVWDNPAGSLYVVNKSMSWLMDGQTRLSALLKAKKFDSRGLVCFVDDDLADNVFTVIDTGKSRTSGQTLSAVGVKNGQKKAGACRLLLEVAYGRRLVDPGENNRFVNAIDALLDLFPYNRKGGLSREVSAPVYAGVLNAIRLDLITPEKAKEFMEDFIGVKGEEDSIGRLAAVHFNQKCSKTGSSGQHYIMVSFTRLAKYYADGKKQARLLTSGKDWDAFYEFAHSKDPSPYEKLVAISNSLRA